MTARSTARPSRRFRDADPAPPVLGETFTAELMFDLFHRDEREQATTLYRCFAGTPGDPVLGLMSQYRRFARFSKLTGSTEFDAYMERCLDAARALDPEHPLVSTQRDG
ncbi:MAG: hypothetical protein AAF628_10705 [Planctomycetota bacterium]